MSFINAIMMVYELGALADISDRLQYDGLAGILKYVQEVPNGP